MITTTLHGRKLLIDSGEFFTFYEEREIAHWLRSMTAEEAAQQSGCSPWTVRWHRKSIREKCSEKSGTGVLAFCFCRQYVRIMTIFLIILCAGPAQRGPGTSLNQVRRIACSSSMTMRNAGAEISSGGLS